MKQKEITNVSQTIPTARNADAATRTEDWTMRLYRDGDIPRLVTLINAIDAIDKQGRATTEEELTRNFAQPLSDPATQVIVAEWPAVEGVPVGLPVGYGRMLGMYDGDAGQQLYQLMVRVHPAAGSRGLDRALIRRLLSMIREKEAASQNPAGTPAFVLANIREGDGHLREAYEALGLKPTRWGWVMERDLNELITEEKHVDGVEVRQYSLPADNTAMLEAYNSSFIDHFEFHPLTREIVDYMIGRPEVRPDLSWVAEIKDDPGKLAGFCICEIKSEANARSGAKEGWIDLLGTVRGWRGKGLGRSLLLRGMRSLKNAGMDTALLGVDSESPTGANRLYESVGFRVRRREIMLKSALADLPE